MKFALLGNPNCGKTTLFNELTGSTAHVGNWPGVTVDKREGTYRNCPKPVTIVDLPGIYSLSPYSPEEVISRNFILEEKPDCVINVVDATNLERNLYLTTQVMEIDVPVVIALNMMDEVEKAGDTIDVARLEKKLNLPIVKISALKNKGLKELMEKAYSSAELGRIGKTVFENTQLNAVIAKIEDSLINRNVKSPLYHAVKLIEKDEIEVKAFPDDAKLSEKLCENFNGGEDCEAVIADLRYCFISSSMQNVLTKNSVSAKNKLTKSDKADKVLTHKIWGIPIFLAILFAVFHMTFSENFLFLGGLIGDKLMFEGFAFEGVLGGIGINSPGVILFNLLDLLTSTFSGLVAGWLTNAPMWVQGFICDGVLGGVFAILSFLPQILLLFLFFSILEDSGYMSRVAFILDRIFRKFGLSGRAFMPMIMGFGCSVPAMVNTRTLADQNERTATIRVIPFFSCGAKLPILTAITGAIVMQFGIGNADIITYSMYLLGIAVALISVIVMRATTMRGEVPPFIMELPTYRMPGFKNLIMHLWDKVKHFIVKAFTIILASTIVIWFISHFSWNWKYLDDASVNLSILAGIGQLLQPIFTPLGFGSQLGEWGWVFAVAAITGLIAKENVIATFGTLAACILAGFEGGEEGIEAVGIIIAATNATIPALLAFIAFNMTTVPCFAAVATAKAELPSKSKFYMTLLFWLAVSYAVSSVIYLVGSWWWTSFIFAAAVAVAVAAIVIVRKRKDGKIIKEA